MSLHGEGWKTKQIVHIPSYFQTWPVPGSEIVGSAELRKHKHENKTEGNLGRAGVFCSILAQGKSRELPTDPLFTI